MPWRIPRYITRYLSYLARLVPISERNSFNGNGCANYLPTFLTFTSVPRTPDWTWCVWYVYGNATWTGNTRFFHLHICNSLRGPLETFGRWFSFSFFGSFWINCAFCLTSPGARRFQSLGVYKFGRRQVPTQWVCEHSWTWRQWTCWSEILGNCCIVT